MFSASEDPVATANKTLEGQAWHVQVSADPQTNAGTDRTFHIKLSIPGPGATHELVITGKDISFS